MITALRHRIPAHAVPVMAAVDTSGVRSSDSVVAVSLACHDSEPFTFFVDLRDCNLEDQEEQIGKYLGMSPAEYRAIYTEHGIHPDMLAKETAKFLDPGLFRHAIGKRTVPLLVTYSTGFQLRFLKKLGIERHGSEPSPLDVVLYARVLHMASSGELPVHADFSMDWESFVSELAGLSSRCKAKYRDVFADYGIAAPAGPSDKAAAIRSLFSHVLDMEV